MSSERSFQLNVGIVFVLLSVLALIIRSGGEDKPLHVEQSLGNIFSQGQEGMERDFGSLTRLVRDLGGDMPVPINGAAPHRSPYFRAREWLASQQPERATLQLGVFSTEPAANSFISEQTDKTSLQYFVIPNMPDPVLGANAPMTVRFVVTFGDFFDVNEANSVAAVMATQRGGRVLARKWHSYQQDAMAAEAEIQRAAASARATEAESAPEVEAIPVHRDE